MMWLVSTSCYAPVRNSISYPGSRAPGRWWNCSGFDRRSEDIPPHFNAPMTMFVPERTVDVTGGCLVKMFGFGLINTCQDLLAGMMGSFGMAAEFVKLLTKN